MRRTQLILHIVVELQVQIRKSCIYRITNNPGVELPATGGPGTRLFTILGSILILGAGILLWRRRRTCLEI